MLPFAIWIAGQLVVFALAAVNFPLVRGQEPTTESWAMPLVLLAQLQLSAVLWPDLFLTVSGTLLTAAVVAPMLALAGVLSGEGYAAALLAMAISLTWLAGLFAWRLVLPRGRQTVVLSLLLAWLLGGMALAYAYAEFGLPPGERGFEPSALASPFLTALQLRQTPADWPCWLVLAAPLLVAAPFLTLRLCLHRVDKD